MSKKFNQQGKCGLRLGFGALSPHGVECCATGASGVNGWALRLAFYIGKGAQKSSRTYFFKACATPTRDILLE